MGRATARCSFTLLLAALGLVSGIGVAAAQDYPARPIRIIVPTPPGGMSDLVSRVYAQRLTEKTKHVVIVENKTGSNGVLAADFVAKSSENMRLTERFTRVDEDTVIYTFTVDDPSTWTKPWSAELPMRKTIGPLFEHACHEGNYGLYNTLAGARVEDKRAAEAAKNKVK